MAEKKTLSAKAILAEIRAGATNDFLMQKYGLSDKGLQSLFKKLLDMKAISQLELDQRASQAETEKSREPPVPPQKETSSQATEPPAAQQQAGTEAQGKPPDLDDKSFAICLFAALTTGVAFAQGATESWLWFFVWILIFAIAALLGYYAFLYNYRNKTKYVVIAGIIFGLAVIGNVGKSGNTSPLPLGVSYAEFMEKSNLGSKFEMKVSGKTPAGRTIHEGEYEKTVLRVVGDNAVFAVIIQMRKPKAWTKKDYLDPSFESKSQAASQQSRRESDLYFAAIKEAGLALYSPKDYEKVSNELNKCIGDAEKRGDWIDKSQNYCTASNGHVRKVLKPPDIGLSNTEFLPAAISYIHAKTTLDGAKF